MKHFGVFCGGVVMVIVFACGGTAYAQAESIVSRDVGFFAAGVDPAAGGQPIQAPTNFPLSQTTCGQAKQTVSGTVVNPSEVRFDDPADVTKDCVITAAAAGVIASIPFGVGYKAAARSRGATTVAAWSALSNPFDRAALPPPTPTNVRVR